MRSNKFIYFAFIALIIILSVAGFVLAAGAGGGGSGSIVTSDANSTNCGVVNSNLTLSADISVSGTCFEINSPDITIDGNGYSIIGDGSGIGLNLSSNTVTIQNFAGITNFSVGINISGVIEATINNNTIQTANESGAVGIIIGGSSIDSTISDNSVSALKDDAYALEFISGNDNTFTSNTFQNDYGTAVAIQEMATSSITFNDNLITGDKHAVLFGMGGTIESVVFNSNDLLSTNNASIYFNSSSDVNNLEIIDSNVSSSNLDTFYLKHLYNLTITNSNLSSNGAAFEFRVENVANATVVLENVSYADESLDYTFEGTFDGNISEYKYFRANVTDILDQEISNVTVVFITNDSSYYQSATTDSTGMSGYGLLLTEIHYSASSEGYNNYSINLTALENYNFTVASFNVSSADSAQFEMPVTCGTFDRSLKLSNNISSFVSECLNISGSDITIDGNSYSVVGPGHDKTGINIYDANNIIVKNTEVYAFKHGIQLDNVSYANIFNDTFVFNHSGGGATPDYKGIYMINTDNYQINITNNYFEEWTRGKPNIIVSGNEHLIQENNFSVGSTTGIIQLYDGNRTIIANNSFVFNDGSTMIIYVPSGEQVNNITIINHTFTGNILFWLLYMLSEDTSNFNISSNNVESTYLEDGQLLTINGQDHHFENNNFTAYSTVFSPAPIMLIKSDNQNIFTNNNYYFYNVTSNVDVLTLNSSTHKNDNIVFEENATISITGNVSFINSTISYNNFSVNPDSSLNVTYYVNFNVTTSSGSALSGATVTVKDVNGTTESTWTTDSNGLVDLATVTEFTVDEFNTSRYMDNHTFTVSKSGYTTSSSQSFNISEDKDTILSISLTATSSSSSGGGGGGGSSSKVEDSFSTSWVSIASGATALADIDVDLIAFTDIDFSVTQTIYSPALEITYNEANDLPSDVAETGTSTHSYYEFERDNLDNSIVGTVDYEFKISGSWLSSNSLSETGIALFGYNEETSTWEQLETVHVNSDYVYEYYEAKQSEFSDYYAIAKANSEIESTYIVPIVTTTEETDVEPVEETPTVTEPKVETKQDETAEKEKNKFSLPVTPLQIGGVVLILAVIAAGVFVYIRRTKYVDENDEDYYEEKYEDEQY